MYIFYAIINIMKDKLFLHQINFKREEKYLDRAEKDFLAAKSEIAFNFYILYAILSAVALFSFVTTLVMMLVMWEGANIEWKIGVLTITVVPFILIIIFAIIMIIGSTRLRANKLKLVSGEIIEFKYWESWQSAAEGWTPIIKLENGKQKRPGGADRDHDELEVGQIVVFLIMMGFSRIVLKSDKEECEFELWQKGESKDES